MIPAVLTSLLSSAVVSKVGSLVASKIPVSSIVGGVKQLPSLVQSKAGNLVGYALPGYLAGRATSEAEERSSDGTALGFLFDIPQKIFASVGVTGVLALGALYLVNKSKS